MRMVPGVSILSCFPSVGDRLDFVSWILVTWFGLPTSPGAVGHWVIEGTPSIWLVKFWRIPWKCNPVPLAVKPLYRCTTMRSQYPFLNIEVSDSYRQCHPNRRWLLGRGMSHWQVGHLGKHHLEKQWCWRVQTNTSAVSISFKKENRILTSTVTPVSGPSS